MKAVASFADQIAQGIPGDLPEPPADDPRINHAPARRDVLTRAEKALALGNALRYVPKRHHRAMAPELAAELARDGRIYMRR